MEQGYLQMNIKGNVGEIEFFHPQANSLPLQLLHHFSDALHKLSIDNSVLVIVIRSKGKVFCAGASFDELLAIETQEDSITFFEGFARLLLSIRNSKKPVVARVQGKAVGGGVGILSACDYVFATEQLSVKLSELSIGIAPFVIAPALIRKIGIGAFNQLYLDSNRWKTAQWCFENKLVSELFASEQKMDIGLTSFLESFEQYNPLALEKMRKITWQDTIEWNRILFENAKYSAQLALTQEVKSKLSKLRKR